MIPKIPNKIFLPKVEIEERMPWIATPYEDDPNWDECYIRKDALLEWIDMGLATRPITGSSAIVAATKTLLFVRKHINEM